MYNLYAYTISSQIHSLPEETGMAVLGKDIFDLDRSATHTKVLFGDDHYWIEDNVTPISYGEILTQILNFDLTPYADAMAQYQDGVDRKDWSDAVAAQIKLYDAFCGLPFYNRYFFEKENTLAMLVAYAGEENRVDALRILLREMRTTKQYSNALEDIRFIQKRYAWFLDKMLDGQDFEKKKGQRKISLADQMRAAYVDALVSGVSLGEDSHVDAPSVNIQYMVHRTEQGNEVVEKLYFDRILDFVYVELMRGMQKGYVPKRCANCGRWFLQTPGATFAYCDLIAPGETVKTCRDIGALASFQQKVRNNEIWQVHQRAYKKYYARVLKKKMTKQEFEVWARKAEQLRNEALENYASLPEPERQQLVEELTAKLNEE